MVFGIIGTILQAVREVDRNGNPYIRVLLELENKDKIPVFFSQPDDYDGTYPSLIEFYDRKILRIGTRLLFHRTPEPNEWFKWQIPRKDRYGFWRNGPPITIALDRLVNVDSALFFCPMEIFLTQRFGIQFKPTEKQILGRINHMIFQEFWNATWEEFKSGKNIEEAIDVGLKKANAEIERHSQRIKTKELIKNALTRLNSYADTAYDLFCWISEGDPESYTWSEYSLMSPRFGFIGRADAIAVKYKGKKKTGRVVEQKFTENVENYKDFLSPAVFRGSTQANAYRVLMEDAIGLTESQAHLFAFDLRDGSLIEKYTVKEEEKEIFLKKLLWNRDEYIYWSTANNPPINVYEPESKKCEECQKEVICSNMNRLTLEKEFSKMRNGIDFEQETQLKRLINLGELPLAELEFQGTTLSNLYLESVHHDLGILKSDKPTKRTPYFFNGAYIRISGFNPRHGWCSALIEDIKPYSIRVRFLEKPSPVITNRKNLRIDGSFIDLSRRSKFALSILEAPELFSINEETRNHFLRFKELLKNPSKAISIKKDTKIGLNPSQEQAVGFMMESEYGVVHGPFGSGKTTVIAYASLELLKKGKKVLIASFTNNAVDNALEKIVELMNEKKISARIVRVGKPEAVRHLKGVEIIDTLEENLEEIKKLKEADLVGVTIVSAFSDAFYSAFAEFPHEKDYPHFSQQPFDVLFLDEATQCILPTAIIPGIFAKKWILIGDHKQLEPVLEDKDAKRLMRSWFDQVIEHLEKKKSYHPYRMLDVQYRCPHEVGEYLSKYFYDSKLKNDPGPKENHHHKEILNIDLEGIASKYNEILKEMDLKAEITPKILKLCSDPKNTLIFIDTLGSCRESGDYSKSNPLEAVIAASIIDLLRHATDDILLLTPYQRQNNWIKTYLKREIRSGTIDSYQGREHDIVLLSLVRSNDEGEIGFLGDLRRLNVAMSRCKKKLIVIGDSTTLEKVGDQIGAKNALLGYINEAKRLGTYMSVKTVSKQRGEVIKPRDVSKKIKFNTRS